MKGTIVARAALASFLASVACQRPAAVDKRPADAQPAASPPAAAPPAARQPPVAAAAVSDIPACIGVEPVSGSGVVDGNLVTSDFLVTLKKHRGKCGCMSAWLLYRSTEPLDDIDVEVASGRLSLPISAPAPVRVRLAVSTAGLPKGPLTVHIGCEPPL